MNSSIVLKNLPDGQDIKSALSSCFGGLLPEEVAERMTVNGYEPQIELSCADNEGQIKGLRGLGKEVGMDGHVLPPDQYNVTFNYKPQLDIEIKFLVDRVHQRAHLSEINIHAPGPRAAA